ncbi:hypothetical protein GCM10027169_28070 [Gordonia jinhuaensis]|nr:WXG100 family type VII secretion target [Gordonia jinhuaensis]
MSDFTVDPQDLHISGHQCATLRTESHEVFTQGHARIDDAVASGWIGSSAQAMQAALEVMRASGAEIIERLDDHSRKFIESATAYQQHDQAAANSITNSGKSFTDPGPLNLD